MAGKKDKFYFENFVEAATCSCETANYLAKCLNDYNHDNIKEMMETIHSFENKGDIKKHEMSAALAKAFVTPVDREDLALISGCIDNVSDTIEEVLQCFYMYRIKKITPEAIEFGEKIVKCCELMKNVLSEFANFKKPEKLHEMIIELNHIEEECDKFYLESNKNLTKHCDNVLDIISWRDIYNKMEACADACEHVADSVEMVVMKNT